ncbi:uncharacterized protein LOC128352189 isoform X2 [Hemicordylus capensis]|uniref:uncharacterized protein LOC128352189 isoform X2 n=1 Tax=Hemicordylus capensis TaxID=884348 RepID=UPI0023047055|nr:uncharacterized protein LOC128352189 isoform X2 [Hemicordylus capensis]
MPKLKGKTKTKPNSDIYILEKFLQTYEKHCTGSQSCVSPTIKQGLQKCIANEMLIMKFVLTNVGTSSGNLHPVSLTPLLRTIRDERYRLGKELCIRGVQLNPQDIANLAILLELDGRTIYPFSKLEITHYVLDLWSMERLGVALPYSNLSSLVLDYSKCGDNGVHKLTSGLDGNRKLLTLSLCYCDLGPVSGSILATIVTQTAICNLFLNGNNLQCLGATELVKQIVDYAESLGQEKKANAFMYSNDTAQQILANKNAEMDSNAASKMDDSTSLQSTTMGKKRKGLKKKSKKPDPGPWLAKLHLADNAIDGRFNETEQRIWEFIHHLTRLIKNSDHLVEIDINGNAIGEQCAAKILDALIDRKKEEMPRLKITVTPQISSVTFTAIFKSGSKISPTKKRKKKKDPRTCMTKDCTFPSRLKSPFQELGDAQKWWRELVNDLIQSVLPIPFENIIDYINLTRAAHCNTSSWTQHLVERNAGAVTEKAQS